MSFTVALHQRVLAVGAAVVACAGLVLPANAASPARASGQPNLVVVAARLNESTIAEGATLTVTDSVSNAGTAKAGATRTRYYLSRDPKSSLSDRRHSSTAPRSSPTDILLGGYTPVPGLRSHAKTKQVPTKVTVPVGTAAGSYTVLACADDTAAVPESDEGDNCRAAAAIKVKAAPGSSGLQLAEFADSYNWPDPSSGLTYLRYFCSATVAPKHLSASAALTSTAKFLTGKAGGSALSDLAHSGLANTAVAAQQLAGAALASGSPGLALAAELRAHDLEPKIATHLINAAAIAETVGLPNEALGLLDGAVALDARRPAMGLSQQAIVDVVRGNALVLTGRSQSAAALFSAARQDEPLLREADAGLANVTGCEAPSATARAYVAASRTRTTVAKDAVIDPGHVPPVTPQLDLTHGRVTPLRQLPAATTPAQGVVQYAVYHDLENGQLLTEAQTQADEQTQLQSQLTAADQQVSLAEQERRTSIMTLAYAFDTRNKKVLSDQAKLTHLYDELTQVREGFFGGGTGETKSKYGQLSDDASAACASAPDYTACYDRTLRSTCVPALTAAHGEWWQLMGELHAAATTWLADASRGMSAYAANLADPVANRMVLLQIEELERAQYFGVVQEAGFWTHYESEFSDHCVEADNSQPGSGPAPETAASSGACTKSLKAISAVVAFGDTKLEVSCEKVKTKISEEVVPFLSVFADVTYDVRTGSLTAVAGVKGGGKVGGIVDAGFKSGLYVTSNGRGEISDVGWRVGPSATVSTGPVNVSAFKDDVDISFLPALTTGP